MTKISGMNVYDETWEQLTKDKAFEGYISDEVCISLCQRDHVIASPTVQCGDFVSKGQVIGKTNEAEASFIHASISGIVEDIFYCPMLPGVKEPFVRIKKTTGKFREWYPFVFDYDKHTIHQMMVQSGIYKKEWKDTKILIVNGFANEPYITSGYRLIMESPGKIVIGAILAAIGQDIKNIYICVNEDSLDAIERMKRAVSKYGQNLGNKKPIWMIPMKHRYPLGEEKIIQKVIGRQDQGQSVIVSLAEMSALYDMVYDGEPWTRVGITVSGNVPCPKNLWVPIGTNIRELIEYCGGMSEDALTICGGPMGGTGVNARESWVRRDTSGILVLKQDSMPVSPCIHCGMCRDACPQNLKPDLIEKNYLECKEIPDSEQVKECIGCGLCSYVCPSGRRLTEYIGQVKKGRMRHKTSVHEHKGEYIEITKHKHILEGLKGFEGKSQSSPYIHRRGTIRDVMCNSIMGLIPLIVGVCVVNPSRSLHILSIIFVGAVAAGLSEYFWQEMKGEYSTVHDGSAIFTGICMALLFSVDTPLWKVGLAAASAIIFGKQCFGGIGHAPVHPAILGKLFFQPFGVPMINDLWYLAIGAIAWMGIQRMQPLRYTLVYLIVCGIVKQDLLLSAVFYITGVYFVWSYETMVPTRQGRWVFTAVITGLTLLFHQIGMGNSGIVFAVAFSNLMIPWISHRSVKRV